MYRRILIFFIAVTLTFFAGAGCNFGKGDGTPSTVNDSSCNGNPYDGLGCIGSTPSTNEDSTDPELTGIASTQSIDDIETAAEDAENIETPAENEYAETIIEPIADNNTEEEDTSAAEADSAVPEEDQNPAPEYTDNSNTDFEIRLYLAEAGYKKADDWESCGTFPSVEGCPSDFSFSVVPDIIRVSENGGEVPYGKGIAVVAIGDSKIFTCGDHGNFSENFQNAFYIAEQHKEFDQFITEDGKDGKIACILFPNKMYNENISENLKIEKYLSEKDSEGLWAHKLTGGKTFEIQNLKFLIYKYSDIIVPAGFIYNETEDVYEKEVNIAGEYSMDVRLKSYTDLYESTDYSWEYETAVYLDDHPISPDELSKIEGNTDENIGWNEDADCGKVEDGVTTCVLTGRFKYQWPTSPAADPYVETKVTLKNGGNLKDQITLRFIMKYPELESVKINDLKLQMDVSDITDAWDTDSTLTITLLGKRDGAKHPEWIGEVKYVLGKCDDGEEANCEELEDFVITNKSYYFDELTPIDDIYDISLKFYDDYNLFSGTLDCNIKKLTFISDYWYAEYYDNSKNVTGVPGYGFNDDVISDPSPSKETEYRLLKTVMIKQAGGNPKTDPFSVVWKRRADPQY